MFIISYLDEDCNECEVNNGGCEQNCINTVQSYYCTCNDSYTLNFDGKTCKRKYNIVI